VIVSGSLAGNAGNAGHTWVFLQYLIGFWRLGLEAYFVEELQPPDAGSAGPAFVDTPNAAYFRAVMEGFGLTPYAGLLERNGQAHVGLSRADITRIGQQADLFLNPYGGRRWLLGSGPRSVYLDYDPGYIQIWQDGYGVDVGLAGHDLYVTVGLNLGDTECPLPSAGVLWEKTLPPVVLDVWATTSSPGAAYTTIANWRGFGALEWQGRWYGGKAEEILRLGDLPRRAPALLELCLSIAPGASDLPAIRANGWRVSTPETCATTPDHYLHYIRDSRGEFACAKHLYVAGHSGWFSDRTASYLACGRPVIVQSTGFETRVQTGEGVLTCTDADSALDALRCVEADYPRHAEAARAFAREHLDSDRVLARLIELAGLFL
jgi:hypothetical protein